MCLVGGVDDVLAAVISSTVGRHIGRLNVEDCNFSLLENSRCISWYKTPYKYCLVLSCLSVESQSNLDL